MLLFRLLRSYCSPRTTTSPCRPRLLLFPRVCQGRLESSAPFVQTITHSSCWYPAQFPSRISSGNTITSDSSASARDRHTHGHTSHRTGPCAPLLRIPTLQPTNIPHIPLGKSKHHNRTHQLEVPTKEGLKGVLKTTVRKLSLNRKHTTRFFLFEGLVTRPRVLRL